MFYNKLLEQFNNGRFSGKSFQEIAKSLEVNDKKIKNSLRLCLEQLERDKKIYLRNEKYYLKTKKGKSIKPDKNNDNYLIGVLRCNQRGFGFLTVEGEADDYFVPPRKMKDALQGDTVMAKLVKDAIKSDEVEVVKVIKRGITELCGTLYDDGKVLFVRPDDGGYLFDIVISSKNQANIGDKVVVEITSFPKDENPCGRITQVLGQSFTLEGEEQAIIISSKINQVFPQNAIEQALSISQEVEDNQLIGRLNLKNELIFTIDGETARDFDDAVSLTMNDKGNYVLGVHIADVSEYVTKDSPLDKEAFERGLSVYLPDKVIPMLPFELSNGICSLNEGVDRLTLSVIAEIDREGNVVACSFHKSVICSKHRMTYTAVQAILDGDQETISRYQDIVPTIKNMYELKCLLKNNRAKNGEVDLTVREADVFMSDGEISVTLHENNDATTLIEQFMIFANERVAEYLTKEKVPCVYRVHDKPSYEKVSAFNAFLKSVGIFRKVSGESPMEYKVLLDELNDEKSFDMVNKTMLRSMQKAFYSAENIGHFGLASNCYLHFTSPIRRYPDLAVHRILKGIIDGKKSQLIDLYADFVEKVSENSSLKEKNAVLCERDVDDLYKVFFMEKYLGEEFVGKVSGVTSFGVFVELENTVEGIIRMENLPRRNYHFNEEAMRLECGKFSLSLGDKVKIGVADVNPATRKIEFLYLQKIK